MKNINTLKNAINPNNLGYSEKHTAQFEGKTYEFFKLESDGNVYVLCVNTNRTTRYNGEGQNGKRISMDAYLEACETLEHEAATKEFDTAMRELGISDEQQFEELMQEAEESATTEEIKEIQKELTPKAKKVRKSKDTAFTCWTDGIDVDSFEEGKVGYKEMTLTAKQVDFIKHLSDTCFWENGLDSCIWVDCLCDEIGGQFAGKPMTVGAMISTLCEKNLGTRATSRRDGRKCTSFALTELGKKVAAVLGLH